MSGDEQEVSDDDPRRKGWIGSGPRRNHRLSLWHDDTSRTISFQAYAREYTQALAPTLYIWRPFRGVVPRPTPE